MPFIIPKQLENVPQDVRDQFKGDSFICTECGGMLIPFTMKRGVCFQCGTEENLNEADWESDDDDDDERTINSASHEDTMAQASGFDIDVIPAHIGGAMDREEVLVDPGRLALAQAMMPKADHASHVIFACSDLMDLFDAITIGDTTYYRDGHTEPYPDPKVYRMHGTRRNSAPIHSDVTGFYQRRKR